MNSGSGPRPFAGEAVSVLLLLALLKSHLGTYQQASVATGLKENIVWISIRQVAASLDLQASVSRIVALLRSLLAKHLVLNSTLKSLMVQVLIVIV